MEAPTHRLAQAEERLILGHYERVAPLIATNFPHVPLIAMYYPRGLEEDATYSGAWHEPLPHTIPSAVVVTPSGNHVYPACAENTILWMAHRYAVGFISWTPSPTDAHAIACAHIGVKPVAGATQQQLKEAMHLLHADLLAVGLDAIPLLNGNRGAALFVPFADTPSYEDARTWLHGLVDAAIARHPTLLIHERRPHEQHTVLRIECTVVANAVGRGSLLPYSLSGETQLPMVTPIEWHELDTINNGDVTAANAAARLAAGDVYAKQAQRLANQRLAGAAR